jgi:hypothetical protein
MKYDNIEFWHVNAILSRSVGRIVYSKFVIILMFNPLTHFKINALRAILYSGVFSTMKYNPDATPRPLSFVPSH